ncbi:putative bifunctional diguanylate cyclase/phosphodiesterase [Shinella oryzae]|uniref:putative bifunctional diguanylate cyclase/phosphodiesterase n=1 Tax=Shinella oryzae TaxID=2871820 RepID=UPI001FF3E8BE|nr:bifunctional diguanylate cyclase/phosphodiesterase [Shinella oryzae]UPA26675.1 EAL domain-containing protein [Shinella oryzae]
MTLKFQSSSLLKWILPASASLAICGILFLTLTWAAGKADEAAASRQRGFITRAVTKLQSAIAHDQESVTVWDDAVGKSQRGDMAWIDANLGSWMRTYFDHDASLLLSPDLSLIYQFIEDRERSPDAQQFRDAYLPLARQLRARLARGDTQGTSAKVLSIGESDLARIGNRSAIVSIKPLISDTGNIVQAPGAEFLHVAIRFLDGDLPADIGQEYAFTNLRFTRDEPSERNATFIPVTSRDGAPVGFFRWEPFQPGNYVLRATAPALVLAFVTLFTGASLAGHALFRRSVRLAASRAELEHQASHDALTGLANRNFFAIRLASTLANAAADQSYCILFVDLDRFKMVNDTFGHPVGDRLIMMAAARMRDLLPKSLIARVGGDEFNILLSDADAHNVDEIARNIVAAIRAPFEIDTVQIAIGASVGAAVTTGPCDPVELTRKADIALYHAKAAGRNTHAIFGSHMDELLSDRRALEADLRLALQTHSQLETFYQPVYAADTGALSSLEALARWKHPTLGYVSPDQFIPLAEESGLIHEISALVLEDACRMLAEVPGIHIAVNASALELASPGYALRVLGILARWQVQPNRLEIELTESAMAPEKSELETTISTLRSAGVRFAIDDFGTGYSTFSRIQRIEVDRIKIDKSFIGEMHQGASRAVVSAMISMAKAKGLLVTAEGVETDEQRSALQDFGCDHLQGFLLSKPLPRSTAITLAAGDQRVSGIRA